MEAQRRSDLATAEVVEQVYKLALEGDPQTINTRPNLDASPNTSSTSLTHHTTLTYSPTARPTPPTYSWLVHLDHELQNYTSRFVDLVSVAESLPVSSASTTVASLKDILIRVSDHASQLDDFHVTDASTLQLRDAMLSNISEVRSYMITVLKVLEDRDGLKPSDFWGGVVLMGKSFFVDIVAMLTLIPFR